MTNVDLLIIGGGINGAAIAADAAGRGLKVSLCEQNDLASGTSSKSTKLIHGGLRYLEYGEFRLVREALKEREILLQKAPHLIHPLRFIMPHNPQLKPAWMLRIGLFLYDHLSKRHRLPASESLDFKTHPVSNILKKNFTRGFAYSDCWTDDARLVIANAIAAREKGAHIETYTRFVSAKREIDYWEAVLENTQTKVQKTIQAKVLVNAAGPWVDDIIHKKLHLPSKNQIRLVKGSHIIVPKLYEDAFAFILTNTDNRVIFVIPYLENYSLIGTTDTIFTGDLSSIQITEEETDYLCQAVNRYFQKSISTQDVIESYAGVRPLHSENTQNLSAITRDYAFELNTDQKQAPLLSIFGGKITTHRKLAEHALQELKPFFPHMTAPWTQNAPLPGGDIPKGDFDGFLKWLGDKYPWLPVTLLNRYAKQYGTRVERVLQDARQLSDLGENLGADLYERELAYLMREEWAKTPEDVLWRRTKLGLCFSVEEKEVLQRMVGSPTCQASPFPRLRGVVK